MDQLFRSSVITLRSRRIDSTNSVSPEMLEEKINQSAGLSSSGTSSPASWSTSVAYFSTNWPSIFLLIPSACFCKLVLKVSAVPPDLWMDKRNLRKCSICWNSRRLRPTRRSTSSWVGLRSEVKEETDELIQAYFSGFASLGCTRTTPLWPISVIRLDGRSPSEAAPQTTASWK